VGRRKTTKQLGTNKCFKTPEEMKIVNSSVKGELWEEREKRGEKHLIS